MKQAGIQKLRHGRILLELNAEKTAWHAETETFFCADLHWGKEATFQKASLPIPYQSLESNLNRLSSLVEQLRPKRVVVLGDMVHGSSSFTDSFRTTMHRFWDRQSGHGDCGWILVEGNHDRRAKSEIKKWPVQIVSPPWRFEDFICVHDPMEISLESVFQPGQMVMAGHIHPAFSMPDNGEKLACFVFRQNTLIFPAFSDFTGRNLVDAKETETVFLIRHGEIVSFSPSR